jgi:MoxR-like ATPase
MTDLNGDATAMTIDEGRLHAVEDRVAAAREAHDALETALFEVKRVIVGQEAMLERVLVALLAGGHVLLEGVPGLAKTLTIKTVADVLGGSFKRLQFTPDLVPSDLVGTRIYRMGASGGGEFDTELGPVFCNFLLADEINRAPAKVQSALLEVMQENQVTIGHESFAVPRPFLDDGDAEPDRVRGHLPAARGAGRPLHVQAGGRLPGRARRGRGGRAVARHLGRRRRERSGRWDPGTPGALP